MIGCWFYVLVYMLFLLILFLNDLFDNIWITCTKCTLIDVSACFHGGCYLSSVKELGENYSYLVIVGIIFCVFESEHCRDQAQASPCAQLGLEYRRYNCRYIWEIWAWRSMFQTRWLAKEVLGDLIYWVRGLIYMFGYSSHICKTVKYTVWDV